ncbi:MAG: LytR/AlgR family response regulator transcription factor [Crocinitomicaceae bacterium]
MEKFKAIIIDDEASARSLLTQLLNRFFPEIEVISSAHDLPSGVASIKKHQPDLVFLDVEMPNYAGYEITQFIDTIDFEIIFITAFDQYAIKAFEMSAVDYLLKPIDIDRLRKAISKFKEKQSLNGMEKAYQALKSNLENESFSRVIIPHQGQQKVIQTADILAFEASEAYTSIHTRDGKYMVSKNLKHFENLLQEHPRFFRTHKSWLINLDFIQSYSKSNLTLVLSDDLNSKVSKYKKADFEQAFNN